MKRIIFAILIALLALTGCTNKYKKEEITNFQIYYNSSVEKLNGNSNSIYIDFLNEEIFIRHIKNSEEIDEKFAINDVETLADYINSIKAHPDNYNRDDRSSEMQIILWTIDIETEDNRYVFTGFDDYPDYWDEMWQVLLDVSDAESLEDFGFKNTNDGIEEKWMNIWEKSRKWNI